MSYKIKKKQNNYYVVYGNSKLSYPYDSFNNYHVEGEAVKADNQTQAYKKVKRRTKGYDYEVIHTSKLLVNRDTKAKVLDIKRMP